jgi:hypothetical protein
LNKACTGIGLTAEMKKITNGEELWKIVDPCAEEF